MKTSIEKRHKNDKLFYGWWIVIAAAIALFMSYPPIIVYSFSVFLKALSQEFNLNRAEISFAFSLASLSAIICTPFVDRLVDRFGACKIIFHSMLIFSWCLISLYLLLPNLWYLYTIYFILGAAGTGTTSIPYSNVISHWFNKKRGLALGLTMAGIGLGALTMPYLAQTLIAVTDCRTTYLLFGFMVLVIAIPVIRVFLKETPQQMKLLPDGEIPGQISIEEQRDMHYGMSSRDVRRTGIFWIMICSFFLTSVSIQGCLIHLVPMLTDRGISAQSAALATSLLGGATLLGRAGTGYLLDRFFAPYVAACLFSGTALGIILFWSGVDGLLAFAAAFLVGLGLGAETDIIPYMVSRYFGLKAFGEIYSYVFTTFPLGGAIGPLLMGISFDVTGSYRLTLTLFLLTIGVSVIMITRLGQYPIWTAKVQTVKPYDKGNSYISS